MYVLSWFLSMILALLATATIAFALPSSAADELSAFTPQIFSVETGHDGAMFVSCISDSN